jgi:hypothetical protein
VVGITAVNAGNLSTAVLSLPPSVVGAVGVSNPGLTLSTSTVYFWVNASSSGGSGLLNGTVFASNLTALIGLNSLVNVSLVVNVDPLTGIAAVTFVGSNASTALAAAIATMNSTYAPTLILCPTLVTLSSSGVNVTLVASTLASLLGLPPNATDSILVVADPNTGSVTVTFTNGNSTALTAAALALPASALFPTNMTTDLFSVSFAPQTLYAAMFNSSNASNANTSALAASIAALLGLPVSAATGSGSSPLTISVTVNSSTGIIAITLQGFNSTLSLQSLLNISNATLASLGLGPVGLLPLTSNPYTTTIFPATSTPTTTTGSPTTSGTTTVPTTTVSSTSTPVATTTATSPASSSTTPSPSTSTISGNASLSLIPLGGGSIPPVLQPFDILTLPVGNGSDFLANLFASIGVANSSSWTGAFPVTLTLTIPPAMQPYLALLPLSTSSVDGSTTNPSFVYTLNVTLASPSSNVSFSLVTLNPYPQVPISTNGSSSNGGNFSLLGTGSYASPFLNVMLTSSSGASTPLQVSGRLVLFGNVTNDPSPTAGNGTKANQTTAESTATSTSSAASPFIQGLSAQKDAILVTGLRLDLLPGYVFVNGTLYSVVPDPSNSSQAKINVPGVQKGDWINASWIQDVVPYIAVRGPTGRVTLKPLDPTTTPTTASAASAVVWLPSGATLDVVVAIGGTTYVIQDFKVATSTPTAILLQVKGAVESGSPIRLQWDSVALLSSDNTSSLVYALLSVTQLSPRARYNSTISVALPSSSRSGTSNGTVTSTVTVTFPSVVDEVALYRILWDGRYPFSTAQSVLPVTSESGTLSLTNNTTSVRASLNVSYPTSSSVLVDSGRPLLAGTSTPTGNLVVVSQTAMDRVVSVLVPVDPNNATLTLRHLSTGFIAEFPLTRDFPNSTLRFSSSNSFFFANASLSAGTTLLGPSVQFAIQWSPVSATLAASNAAEVAASFDRPDFRAAYMSGLQCTSVQQGTMLTCTFPRVGAAISGIPLQRRQTFNTTSTFLDLVPFAAAVDTPTYYTGPVTLRITFAALNAAPGVNGNNARIFLVSFCPRNASAGISVLFDGGSSSNPVSILNSTSGNGSTNPSSPGAGGGATGSGTGGAQSGGTPQPTGDLAARGIFKGSSSPDSPIHFVYLTCAAFLIVIGVAEGYHMVRSGGSEPISTTDTHINVTKIQKLCRCHAWIGAIWPCHYHCRSAHVFMAWQTVLGLYAVISLLRQTTLSWEPISQFIFLGLISALLQPLLRALLEILFTLKKSTMQSVPLSALPNHLRELTAKKTEEAKYETTPDEQAAEKAVIRLNSIILATNSGSFSVHPKPANNEDLASSSIPAQIELVDDLDFVEPPPPTLAEVNPPKSPPEAPKPHSEGTTDEKHSSSGSDEQFGATPKGRERYVMMHVLNVTIYRIAGWVIGLTLIVVYAVVTITQTAKIPAGPMFWNTFLASLFWSFFIAEPIYGALCIAYGWMTSATDDAEGRALLELHPYEGEFRSLESL